MSVDIGQALRIMRRQPGFSLLAVATLALGMGASAVMLSLAYAVFLRPLPFPDEAKILTFVHRHGSSVTSISLPTVMDYRAQLTAFASYAVSRPIDANLTGGGEPQRVQALAVSPDFFEVFGMAPARGRRFMAHEDQPGSDRVVVISDELWTRRWARQGAALGAQLSLNGDSYTVVGIMPPGFNWGRAYGRDRMAELWVPYTLTPERLDPRTRGWEHLDLSARLASQATAAQAQAELDVLAERLRQQYPRQYPSRPGWTVRLEPLREELVSAPRRPVVALVWAAALLLVIACTNVAGLFLFRTAAREREVAIRMALGASRKRLFTESLVEASVLSAAAVAAGALLALWGIEASSSLLPASLPGGSPSLREAPVVLMMAAVAALCALAVAAVSAASVREVRLGEGLRLSRTGHGLVHRRTRTALVTGQIALSTLLLAGAGLLAHTMARLLQVDPGFRSGGVLVGEVALPRKAYAESWRRTAFYNELLARVGATAGVRSAAAVSVLPLGTTGNAGTFEIEGRLSAEGQELPHAQSWVASPGYFETLGVRLLRGRVLAASDTAAATPVVVISEEMARRYWPGEDALGKRIDFEGGTRNRRWREVVGVVADVRHRALDRPPTPQYYIPLDQGPEHHMYVLVRTDGEPLRHSSALREAIRAQDPDQPLFGVATMDEIVAGSLAQRRLAARLLAGFAGTALLLCCIGVYGLLAQAVAQRRQEFAVRLAVGASPRRILRLVLASSARMAGLGLLVGLMLTAASARLLGGLLYEVRPLDPVTYAAVAVVLGLTVQLAAAIPARRAARVDPITALR